MQAQMAPMEQLRTRETIAEEELERIRKERETSAEQTKALATNKKNLLDDVDAFCQHVSRRNASLKSTRKKLHKMVKKLS